MDWNAYAMLICAFAYLIFCLVTIASIYDPEK